MSDTDSGQDGRLAPARETVDAVVIGAGVVGLACARLLAARGYETLVLDRHGRIGAETSSRNSEVIHAGFYYPTESQKARLCVPGARQLREYCRERGIAHRLCGKLVVAGDAAGETALGRLFEQGRRNGVVGLELLSGEAARAMEPELTCSAALWSPETGILDSHALIFALASDAERDGAILALHSPVSGGTASAEGVELFVGGADPLRLKARRVINAAGLEAPRLAASLAGFPAERVPQAAYAKGSYFSLVGRVPFGRLIYPLPEAGGLGVHLTLDLAGQARFGPDVEWVEHIDYQVDAARGQAFYEAIRRYWPGLPDGALEPAFCGIRPKLGGPGIVCDFVVQGPAEHGIPGLVNLFGIESPGLTACLALAEHALLRLP